MKDLKNFQILVKTVRFFNPETRFAVFTADVMKAKRNTYVPSKNIQTFVGRIFSVNPGDKFSVSAFLDESVEHGTQYRIQTYSRVMPASLEEIKTFLAKFSGLGPARVKKLTDTYGLDVLETLRSSPSVLTELGLSPDAAAKIHNELIEDSCFEEILAFLHLNDLDFRYAMPIFTKYKTMALRKIKDNPYSLFHDRIIDFRTADCLANKLGFDWDTRERTEAAVLACISDDSETYGNLYLPYSMLMDRLESFLSRKKTGYASNSFSKKALSDAVEVLVRSQQIVAESVSDDVYLYLRQNYWAETKIVEKTQALSSAPKRFSYEEADVESALAQYEAENHIRLALEQKQAVITALCSHVSIITGGPGTGKSASLNALIYCIKVLSPDATLRMAAPTGKAALRMTELTNCKAATIHRTLQMGRQSQQLKSEELECDFFIVDEFSMVDCFLCATLLDAVVSYARVVIVGDHEQLPSVGPGLVLRDMIASGKVPVTRLIDIFRQGKTSAIVKNSHEIIRERVNEIEPYRLKIDKAPGGEFYFVERESVSQIQQTICASVHQLMNSYRLRADEIRVLSTIHGGDLGTNRLNRLLQDEFNPFGEVYEREDGLEIRIGDPVIHLQNNYDLGVFNGEAGIVKAFGYDMDKAVMVEYPGSRHVWYSEQNVDELDLAYAITVHKAQGTEAKAVVLPVHDTLRRTLSKNLLYTGITRAKDMVVIVGSKEAFSAGIRKSTVIERRSNLIKRLNA